MPSSRSSSTLSSILARLFLPLVPF
ncbi:hypothetical protein CSAL01_13745, partial [Colletotrichum salicis]